MRFFYDEPARLRYAAAAGVARLLSRSGVQQGDPLASVLFSVAIQPALLEIQATAVGDAAGAVVVAQIDDVYLVGPSEWVEASYATLQVAYARIGLQLRHAKGAIYSPLGVPPADADEVHDARGFLVGHRHSRMRPVGSSCGPARRRGPSRPHRFAPPPALWRFQAGAPAAG